MLSTGVERDENKQTTIAEYRGDGATSLSPYNTILYLSDYSTNNCGCVFSYACNSDTHNYYKNIQKCFKFFLQYIKRLHFYIQPRHSYIIII